ncbi:hypothetical protein Aduo_011689 [Ancylostoma duodenale]
MAFTFHKKPIKYAAQTLETLLDKYKSYSEGITPAGEEEKQYDEYSTAVNLIRGGISIVQSSKKSLEILVEKLEKDYEEAKSKGNKKDLINEIEDIDKEARFTEIIPKANELVYILEARTTEYRDKMYKLAANLGVDPHKSELKALKGSRIPVVKKELRTDNAENDSDAEIDPNEADWLSEDISENSDERKEICCRTLKPKQLKLPRFYGDEEEFPEFWAVFETLVHESKVLTTVEKMLLLKDSLEEGQKWQSKEYNSSHEITSG